VRLAQPNGVARAIASRSESALPTAYAMNDAARTRLASPFAAREVETAWAARTPTEANTSAPPATLRPKAAAPLGASPSSTRAAALVAPNARSMTAAAPKAARVGLARPTRADRIRSVRPTDSSARVCFTTRKMLASPRTSTMPLPSRQAVSPPVDTGS
jgi:hypothetical protein